MLFFPLTAHTLLNSPSSSNLFASLHPRSIFPNPLRRLNSHSSTKRVESQRRSRQEFEAAHSEEMALMSQIEELRDKVDSLKAEVGLARFQRWEHERPSFRTSPLTFRPVTDTV